jgi:ferric-dicitrate binding protein FerR (iron transport regulator)
MKADRPTPMTAEEARAREALRALAPARAEPAFRERLKRDFVTGRIGERRALEWPVAWPRRLAWRLALAPAALALIAIAMWTTDRGPGWAVLAARGEGEARVNGTPVPLASREALARGLRPGTRLSVPAGASLELASASGLVIEITGGTELIVPGTPGRWLRRRVSGALRHGEVRVTTGPAFAGALLRLGTPEAVVEVTGTTLAVICEPAGTCVCVYEGVVKVGPPGAGMEPVPQGRRRYVFKDGRPPESAAIRPVEGVALARFRDGRRAYLEGGAP